MKRKRITPEITAEIKRLHSMGMIDRDIADKIGFSKQTVFDVRSNRLGLCANGHSGWRPGKVRVVPTTIRPRIEKIWQENGVTVTRYASAAPVGYHPTRMQSRDWELGI